MTTDALLLAYLQQNPFILAPMAGITDSPFRAFMKENESSIVVSELVSASGIRHQSEKTVKLLHFTNEERPVGLQLFGSEPLEMADAARLVQDLGADFVDLNFGCPVPKVVKKGGGSAILRDLQHFANVLRSVRAAVKIPVTIKIRTGWDETQRNSPEVCRIAYEEGILWVAIHGRSRAQGYSGLADWNYIREVAQAAPLPVLGNGDVLHAGEAVARLQQSGCRGVLIGRGALRNPWIFQEAQRLRCNDTGPVLRDYCQLIERLLERFESAYTERIFLLQVKKFASWFSSGLPGASTFRKELFGISDKALLKTLIRGRFAQWADQCPILSTEDGFLMGGHG